MTDEQPPSRAEAHRSPTTSRPRRSTASRRRPADGGSLLRAMNVSKVFGGLVAVDDVNFAIPRARDRLDHRAQRRRQDDVLQHAHRPLQADASGAIAFDGHDITARAARQDHGAGHRAHVPEHPPVRHDERAGERAGRPARAHEGRAVRLDLPHAGRAQGGAARCARRRARLLEYVGLQPRHLRQLAINLSYGDQRRVEIARALASDPKLLLLDEPTAGMNPQESARADRVHAPAARRARPHDPAHRARHEGRHGRVRAASPCSTTARRSPRAIPQRGPREPAGHRGLPRAERRSRADARRCSRSTTSTPSTATSRRSRASRWRSTRARSSRSSAPTAPASRRRCARSPASRRRARARSASTARRSRPCPRRRSSSMGISQSPEGRHCFPRMTVRENLEMGAYLRRDAELQQDLDRVYDLFPRLKERESQKAGTMSGGEQQMLAIGRALMARPKLLLLDEPSMGIAPILVERIYETIARDQPPGHDDPAGRAERQLRARRLPARLRAGDRHGRAQRRVGRAAHQPRGPEGVPGHMIALRPPRRQGASTLLYSWLLSAIVCR